MSRMPAAGCRFCDGGLQGGRKVTFPFDLRIEDIYKISRLPIRKPLSLGAAVGGTRKAENVALAAANKR